MSPHPAELLSFARELVDSEMLPGLSWAVLRDGESVDSGCVGWADREQRVALRQDHIFRAYSNTKLVTSCAALLLMEQGKFQLDDPIKEWIPALGRMRVLRPNAQVIDDTEAAQSDITIRQLFTHSAGFTTGVFGPGSLLHTAYGASGVRSPLTTLAQEMLQLAGLPLQFQPGTGWEYSASTDVLARLVEVISGQRFGDYLQQQVLGPLGMKDTGYVLRPEQRERFTALYGAAAGRLDAGLQRLGNMPYAGAYEQPVARQSGAGGLFTTQADMLALLQSLLSAMPRALSRAAAPGAGLGSSALLKPDTVAQLMRNQISPELCVQFADSGPLPSLGFRLAGAVTMAPSALGGEDAVGEIQWGGLAGTHWWIAPNAAGGQGLAGVVMTHRFMAFWNPFWFDFKRRVHAAHAAPGVRDTALPGASPWVPGTAPSTDGSAR